MAIKIQVTNATIVLDDVGEGTPVLLLHGFPVTRYLWSRLVKLPGGHFTPLDCPVEVAAELRGFLAAYG